MTTGRWIFVILFWGYGIYALIRGFWLKKHLNLAPGDFMFEQEQMEWKRNIKSGVLCIILGFVIFFFRHIIFPSILN